MTFLCCSLWGEFHEIAQTLAHILPNTVGSKVDINIPFFALCSRHVFLSGDMSHTFVDILFPFTGKHPTMGTTTLNFTHAVNRP